MKSKRDAELLSDYAERGSEAAFAELVRRHVDLVYSAAFRMVRNRHLAQEVSQCVFLALSRDARRLMNRPVLSGWLHCTARNQAAKVVRTEERRRAREQEAAAMNQLNLNSPAEEPLWERMAPHLDDALARLRAADRDIVLLRFFERRSTGEIGQTLGLSEAAVRKRVARALERLRRGFTARGVTASAALIASTLGAHSVEAAPPEVAAALTRAVGSGASLGPPVWSFMLKALLMTKLQTTIIGLLFVAGLTTPLLIESPAASRVNPARTTRRVIEAAPTEPVRAEETETSPGIARLRKWVRLARMRTIQDNFDDDQMRYLAWSLSASDYPGAWLLSEQLPHGIRGDFRRYLLHYWGERDPRAALRVASASGGGWGLMDPANGILEDWAKREPSAALAWVRQTEPANMLALAQVITQAAQTDPSVASAALANMPPGALHDAVASELTNAWVVRDPAAAASYVLGLPASGQRSGTIQALATSWAQSDAAAAIAWAQGLTDVRERSDAVSGILNSLGQFDPVQVAPLLSGPGSTNLNVNTYWVGTMAKSWAERDLGAALAWATNLPEGRPRSGALGPVLRRWARKDPAAAAEFALQLPSPSGPLDPLPDVLGTWAGEDSQAALDWAVALPEGSRRDAAVRSVLGSLDPSQAAPYISQMPPSQLQSQAASDVAYRWAIADAEGAAQWVQDLPEGSARQTAAKSLLRGWCLDSETSAPDTWIEGLPAGPTQSAAARAFVLYAGEAEPALAAHWVSAFSNEQERDAQIERIGRAWLQSDPAPARTWLQGTPLPAEEKQKLLGQSDK
jgi:RNA polymerase sigma factor (sigma-70 family)